MIVMNDFNPNSMDSTFAMIIQRLDNQDKLAAEYRASLKEMIGLQNVILQEIKAETKRTNGRVTSLENEKWFQRGYAAAAGAGLMISWEVFKSFFTNK